MTTRMRKAALPLALLLGLGACMEPAPLAAPATQGAAAVPLRDWIAGATVAIRPVQNPELFQTRVTTFNRDGSFSTAMVSDTGVVSSQNTGRWSIRNGQFCDVMNPVSIARPPMCSDVTITGPDTAIFRGEILHATWQVTARN